MLSLTESQKREKTFMGGIWAQLVHRFGKTRNAAKAVGVNLNSNRTKSQAPTTVGADSTPASPTHSVYRTPPDPKIAKQALRTNVLAAFNATQPVPSREELHGRQQEIETLSDAVLGQNMHAIIHGARGSGKTSLVRVFGDYADERGTTALYQSCDEISSFSELLSPYLAEIPTHCLAHNKHAVFRERLAQLGTAFGPREVVGLITELVQENLVFIIDEFDRITSPELLSDVATFLKLLSDALAPVRIVLVSIGSSVGQIIDNHNSLRRHLIAVHIECIDRNNAGSIIDFGSKRTGLNFDDETKDKILCLASGSPYHVRLFCLHAALEAIKNDKETVSISELTAGLKVAFARWTLFNQKGSELFGKLVAQHSEEQGILSALAVIAATKNGFTLAELKKALPERDTGSIRQIVNALDKVLTVQGAQESLYQFEDSLAPQFLLVAITLFQQKQSHEVYLEPVEGVAA